MNLKTEIVLMLIVFIALALIVWGIWGDSTVNCVPAAEVGLGLNPPPIKRG